MAVVADRVVVELEARLDKYNANLKRAERNFSQSVNSQQREMRQLEAQISRSSGSIGSSLRALAGTFAAAFSVRQIQQYADSYTRFVNQLKVAGTEGENLGRVQNALIEIANKNGVAFEGLGTLYSRSAQVSKELGASQAQLIQFSGGVAAALKIQGTSATEARGALLQLSQALGSGIVRAEEFNSINEGALPILQAVARNMDAAGGSVARLKTLVNEGKVSSDEFFQAFLAGTADLEKQAESASLTIGGAFEVLNNNLGVYIGQADDSLSATERISAAIVALSENLDKVVTALAVLSALLLGRYVAGLAAAATGTGLVSTAIFAMQARAIGAATTMEALALASTTAGRAMLAAFGGPVGLAVAALAAGIYFLATRTDEAGQASAEYVKQVENAKLANEKAAAAADELANATGRSREQSLANAKALREETLQLLANAKAAVAAAIAKKQGVIADAQQRVRQATRSTAGAGSGYDPAIGAMRQGDARTAQAQRDVWAAVEAVGELNKALYQLDKSIAAAPAVRDVAAPSGKPGPKRTPRDTRAADAARAEREAEQAARAQAAYLAEIDRLAVDELALKAELTGAIGDRLAAEMARIEADALDFQRQVALDEELTEAKREKLLAERAQVDTLRRQKAEQDAALAEMEKQNALERADGQILQEIVRAKLALATGRQERGRLEKRLLELQHLEERAELERLVATYEMLGIENEALRIAKARLVRLQELEGLESEAVERENESPLEKYRRGLDKSDEELADEAEQLIVDEIEHVRSSMRDALADAIGTDDPLITGLLDLLIEQVILKPLTDALAGAGGAGGLGGSIGTFFSSLFGGRASGGHVRGGNMYRVTDGEGFQPAGSGKIIPLGRMRAAGGGGGVTLQQTVNVDARGVNPEGFAEHIRESVRQETVAIVGHGIKKATQAVPGRMAQFERDGT